MVKLTGTNIIDILIPAFSSPLLTNPRTSPAKISVTIKKITTK